MDSIRLQHLRCLTDTGDIALKPMTVLLGQNSSGKSTFLRFFPLLKQSVEARTSGPILWYGRLVDFGTYQEAKQKGQDEDIVFSFKFPYLPNPTENVSFSIQLAKNSENEFTITRQLSLEFLEHKITIIFNDDQEIKSFKINQLDFSKEKYFAIRHILFLFPNIQRTDMEKDLRLKIKKHIKEICHNTVTDEELDRIIKNFPYPYQKDDQTMLLKLKDNHNEIESWRKNTQEWKINTSSFRKLWELLIVQEFPELIYQIDEYFLSFSKQIKYIAPVRVLAERYERIRDLRTNEIEPRGENLAMFIYHLSKKDFRKFQEWTLKNFEFDLRLIKNAGMVSIEIRTQESDQFINIVDVGSGFSQMLPMITQLWIISELRQGQFSARYFFDFLDVKNHYNYLKFKIPFIFAIEQPELHLHPRLQGILTDVLVKSIKVAKENEIDLRLVIETHSKVLINRLGQLIDKGSISADDINLVLFEPSDDPQKVNVRTTNFNKDGYINNWPLGFLDMDLDLDVD